MKLQLDFPLIRTVREPEVHRVPQNLILKIMLFIAVFYLAALAQTAFLMLFALKDIIAIMYDTFQMAQEGISVSREATMERFTALMNEPWFFVASLFSTAGGTLVVMLWCRFVEGRKFRTMGFFKKKAAVQYLIGLGVGFAAFSAVVGLSMLFGGVKFIGFKGQFTPILLLTFLGYGLQGMNEEVICRGYILTSTVRHQNIWWAIGINSVIFGLAHIGNNGVSVLSLVNIALCGVMLSLYMLRTNSIWGACAFHSIWNFVQGNFYGLPVSGMESGDTVFSFGFQGTELVNGGAFGLEAGIAMTIVSVVGILCLLFVPNPFAKKNGETKPETEAA